MILNKSKFDKNGESMKFGLEVEQKFKELAENKGFTVLKSSREDDIKKHIDFTMTNKIYSKTIDVKGMRKISRSDNEVQDDWLWIEIHGVNKTNKGWLYGGKADLIGFQTKTNFILVERLDLLKLIPHLVKKEYVKSPNEAKYMLYKRKDRFDIITMINIRDLYPIIFDIL